MKKEMFTSVKGIMVEGMPMFLAADVRELLNAKDKPLEVTPVVIAVDGVTKAYHMVSLVALVDVVLQKTLDESEDEFVRFIKHLFESMEDDDHESDPD